jgi:predicted CXXCH cytochrome family protein
VNRNLLPSHLRRAGVACAVTAAVLVLPRPASGGLVWNLGAALGYGSLACAVVLYLYPLRAEGIAHRRLFTVSQHRRIGWIALSLAALHTAVLLVAQPLTGHYLLPSAPMYMLCGLAALIALAVLVATGISARSTLRRAAAPRATSANVATHAVLAGLLPGLLAAHLVGSGQLLDRPLKTATCCVLLALALAWSAWRPRSKRISNRLFSTVIPSSIALATLLLWPTPIGGLLLLRTAAAPAPLHAYFPHENHRTVSCIACHHNFVDKTGFGSCFDCHRSTRADLPQALEATFHRFCRDCHSALAREENKHGPVRVCSGCHVEATARTVLSNSTPICENWNAADSCLSQSEAADRRPQVFQAAHAWGFR